RILTPVIGSDVMAGVAISAVAFLAALVMLHNLTEAELGRPAANATVLLLCFAPLSFFFSAVYSESLFLALSVATVAAQRSGRSGLACALGALATLTRPTGILLCLALVVMRLRGRRSVRELAWVLVIPATLAAYLALLAARGYPPLAPFSAQALWGRVTVGPVAAVAAGVWSALRGAVEIANGGGIYHPLETGLLTPGAESVALAIVLVGSCLAVAGALRRLPLEYGALAAAELLMCLSSPAVGQPLLSFDRYALTIFPLWMAAGAWVARRRLTVPAVVLGGLLLVFYTVQFSSWSFVA
ncbi:MAG: mannosyltransferase family protein, partial [Solirubrobacteraceae bacterium]